MLILATLTQCILMPGMAAGVAGAVGVRAVVWALVLAGVAAGGEQDFSRAEITIPGPTLRELIIHPIQALNLRPPLPELKKKNRQGNNLF